MSDRAAAVWLMFTLAVIMLELLIAGPYLITRLT